MVRPVCCAVVPGTAARGLCVARIAVRIPRGTPTTSLVSVVPEFKSQEQGRSDVVVRQISSRSSNLWTTTFAETQRAQVFSRFLVGRLEE